MSNKKRLIFTYFCQVPQSVYHALPQGTFSLSHHVFVPSCVCPSVRLCAPVGVCVCVSVCDFFPPMLYLSEARFTEAHWGGRQTSGKEAMMNDTLSLLSLSTFLSHPLFFHLPWSPCEEEEACLLPVVCGGCCRAAAQREDGVQQRYSQTWCCWQPDRKKALHITSRACHSLHASRGLWGTGHFMSKELWRLIWIELSEWHSVCWRRARDWRITTSVAAIKWRGNASFLSWGVCMLNACIFVLISIYLCVSARVRLGKLCFLWLCELPGSVFNSCIKGYSQFVSVDQATGTAAEWNVNI